MTAGLTILAAVLASAGIVVSVIFGLARLGERRIDEWPGDDL